MTDSILFLIIILFAAVAVWQYRRATTATAAQAESEKQQAVLQTQLDGMQKQADDTTHLQTDNARLTAELQQTKQAASERAEQMEKVNAEMKTFLEKTAREILSENTDRLKKESKESLGNIINPLQGDLHKFRQRLDSMHTENAAKSQGLKESINTLLQHTRMVNQSADNLSRALKGDKKLQGNWGEKQLQTLLDLSGLVEGSNYEMQYSIKTKDGAQQYFDCLIRLPHDKCLIIDSKVSLVAYERYINAEADDDDSTMMKQHIDSIRNHIRDLSGKKYHKTMPTVDFVLLFMPLEPAFMAALQHTPDLFKEAQRSKIALASPTTLLPILKTVAYLWEMDEQQRNIDAIVDRGQKLHEKASNFLASMSKLGESLHDTVGVYNEASKRLSEGHGNLLSQARKLEKLKIKSSKNLSTPPAVEATPKLPQPAGEE